MDGIQVDGQSNAVIGGTGGLAGNIISGNGRHGISVSNNSEIFPAVVVQGNIIGLDQNGAQLGNANAGIAVTTAAVQVGGTSEARRAT